MSDLLSIGSSGVTAYQRALATVSNNIANVNTEGYTRQAVSIGSSQPTQVGGSYIGTGAQFDRIRRLYDAFVESNLRNSNSDLKSQEPLLSYVNRLIDVMGDQSIGLTTAMNLFFESGRNLASDPASTVQRSIFLRDADGLAARFRQLSSQFDLLDNETRQSVQTDIGQVNSLTQQLALLNKQLAKKATMSDQPSELLDQRDLLLRNLSGLIAVKTSFTDNGSVLVSVGDTINQGILVNAEKSRDISVIPSPTDPLKIQLLIDPYGRPEGLPGISGGKIGGVMTFREQVLSPAADALDSLAQTMTREVNALHRDGIDAEGKLGGDLFGFGTEKQGRAGGMILLIQDAARVAAAGQFRVIDDPLNPGTAQARIGYADVTYQGPQGLVGSLANALVPQIGSESVQFGAQENYASVGVISAGMQDITLSLDTPGETRNLQVFTRDGRHLLGTTLDTDTLNRIVRTANGMEAGAVPSEVSLNNGAYLGMDLFLGAKASVQFIQQFNASGKLIDPKAIGAELAGKTAGTDWSQAIGQAGKFILNGQMLSAATAGQDLAAWINGQNPPIAGVTARMANGALVLSARNTNTEIRLGLGPNGTTADLASIGFKSSLHVAGVAKDDLLVFVTDTSGNSPLAAAQVGGQFAGITGDSKQLLRAQSLLVSFKDHSTYEILDTNTNTVLAERTLGNNATPTIHYRGLTLEFTTTPQKGDKFRIDGNQDGIGNNEAMLKLVALEDGKVMPGGLTLTEAYIERVNLVGNVARQAAISNQALTVVYQQAQEARDGVSGVSLDEEASELVRFQQAYQANAKVMQIASQLFDSILQVR